MTTIFRSFRHSRRTQLAVAVGVLVAAGLTVGAGQRWARSRVIQLAADSGVEVKRADVSVSPLGSATLRNLTWSAGALSATVESVEVEVALLSLFSTPRSSS